MEAKATVTTASAVREVRERTTRARVEARRRRGMQRRISHRRAAARREALSLSLVIASAVLSFCLLYEVGQGQGIGAFVWSGTGLSFLALVLSAIVGRGGER